MGTRPTSHTLAAACLAVFALAGAGAAWGAGAQPSLGWGMTLLYGLGLVALYGVRRPWAYWLNVTLMALPGAFVLVTCVVLIVAFGAQAWETVAIMAVGGVAMLALTLWFARDPASRKRFMLSTKNHVHTGGTSS